MSELRTFLAIDLKDDLREKVWKIEQDFKKIDAEINYVEEKNLHFTLKFFGNIEETQIDEISEKIEKVLENYKPFGINIKGCGAFPSKNHIKTIWIGSDDNKIIKELHDDLDKEFESIGFKKDNNFSTHMTIGRMKSSKGKEEVKNKIEKYENKEVGPMDIKRIVLKKSILTENGPVYHNLKEYKVI